MQSETLSENNEKEKNISVVETQTGRYEVVYSRHDTTNNPAVVHRVDGLVLEAMEDYDTPQKASTLIGAIFLKDEPQYSEVVKTAEEEGKPIFLADISEDFLYSVYDDPGKLFGEHRITRRNAIAKYEGILSLVFLGNLAAAILRDKRGLEGDKKMDRRKFMKTLFAAGAAYFATPFVEKMLNDKSEADLDLPDVSSTSRKAEKTAMSVNRVLHPETRTISWDTRNVLIAQKTEAIARILEREKGRKASLAVLVGANHIGIEGSFKEGEEIRMKKLKKKMGSHLEREGIIARIDFLQIPDKRLAGSVEGIIKEINPHDVPWNEERTRKLIDRLSSYFTVTILRDPAFRQGTIN